MHTNPVGHALSKTVILVAAGGDASRLRAGLPPNDIAADFTGVTFPITRIMKKGSLQLVLEEISAAEVDFGLRIPTVVVVGPNTKDALKKLLGEYKVEVIEQRALPVMGSDKKIVVTPTGNVLGAPDGTGGVMEAFWHSPLRNGYEVAGKDKIVFLHGNCVVRAQVVLDALLKQESEHLEVLPVCSKTGMADKVRILCSLYEQLRMHEDAETRARADALQEDVEDNIPLYVLSWRAVRELIGKMRERPQLKQLSLRNATGEFEEGYKFEKYLSEVVTLNVSPRS